MAMSKKLLSQDEVVVRHMHTHVKTLLPAIIIEVLLLVAAAIGIVLRACERTLLGVGNHMDHRPRAVDSALYRAVGEVVDDNLHGHDKAGHHPHRRH